jgi:hypothetical protein
MNVPNRIESFVTDWKIYLETECIKDVQQIPRLETD